MTKKKAKKREKILSASRIKTFESCSWIYYCKYNLKLPDKSNDGAKRGNCVHLVLECLLNPRHKKHYDTLIEKRMISSAPPVERLIRKQAKKEDLVLTNENKQMIREMILVALESDFFCKGGELFKSEFEFIIESDDPKYKIKGFIDKMARFPNNTLKIYDYKTSKSKFEGEEITNNVQSMAYQLYGKKVEGFDNVFSDFLFLRFPDDPTVEINFDDEKLDGFELYLEYLFEQINNFDERHATTNLAAHKPFAKKGEGFKGRTMCGRAGFAGQKKKDGNPMWHCAFKFPFDYYVKQDKDGRVIESAFEKKDLTESKGCTILQKKYSGCPAFNNCGAIGNNEEEMF